MNANVPKSGDNSTALSLVDVGPPREPAKLRILDDEGPLTIKARKPVADARPRGGDWPYRMVPVGDDCHVTDVRNGEVIRVYGPGEVRAGIALMDDLNDQYRRDFLTGHEGECPPMKSSTPEKEGATGRDAPPPNMTLAVGQVWKDGKGRSAEITALGDDWVYYLSYLPAVIGSAEENDSHEDVFRSDFPVFARDATPPNDPPFDEMPRRDDADLDPNISAALDVIAGSAVCECEEGSCEPCKGKVPLAVGQRWSSRAGNEVEIDALDCAGVRYHYTSDNHEVTGFREAKFREIFPIPISSWPVSSLDKLDADLVAMARQPERRSHLDGTERVVAALELMFATNRRKAIRRLLVACSLTFVAGLAIGAILAHIL